MVAETAARRRGIVTFLVILASLVAFLAIFASWVKQQALDTDEWTNTSSQLLEDKEIRNAVSIYLVDQLYSNVDVTAEVRGLLPPRTQKLAGPISGGLRDFAQRAANRALASPKVQEAWKQANRRANKQLLLLLDDKGKFVSTSGGEVTLDLHPLVVSVSDRIGLGSKVTDKLPPGAGQLRIMKADQLETAQSAVNLVENLAIILPLLWLVLWALAMYLAVGRRRETVKGIGLGLIIAGLAVVLLRALAGDAVVGALSDTATVSDAANNAWTIATSLLSEITASVIAVGVLLLIGAWLAGPTRPAVSFRRAAAPYMRENPALTYGVVGVIYLLLLVWAPVRAFTRPVPLLVIGALMLLGTEALRRHTAREFPDAQMPEGGIREAFRGGASKARSAVSPGAAADPQEARLQNLERLNSLKEKGVLSQEEFEAQKAAILAS